MMSEGWFLVCLCSPKAGTPHFQGFIQFFKKQGRKRAVSYVGAGAHLEQRRGTVEEATNYCLKEEGRIEGPWRFGERIDGPGGLQRTHGLSRILDLVRHGGSLVEAAQVDPTAFVRNYRGITSYRDLVQPHTQWRDVRCFFLEGEPGCGKSSLVYEAFDPKDVYTLAKQAPLWFNSYLGQSVLFIDEYQGSIVREELLRILDGHRYLAEYKGGFCPAAWTCVVIASNFSFGLWRDGAIRRRFERGGYFKLSGKRGEYPLLSQRVRGDVVDGLDAGVRQVQAFFNVVDPEVGIAKAWNYEFACLN